MKNIKMIIIVCIIILLFSITIMSGCKTIRQIDPCEREYTECVHECGEGILSSICKEKCTSDRTKCNENGK
jgi:uncharacterized protein YceK